MQQHQAGAAGASAPLPMTDSELLPVPSTVKRPRKHAERRGILKPPGGSASGGASGGGGMAARLPGGLGSTALGASVSNLLGGSISGFLTGKPGGHVSVGGILQNINTKLAQQGMNVQVPLPRGDGLLGGGGGGGGGSGSGAGGANGAASSGAGFGGMLKRWGLVDDRPNEAGTSAGAGAPSAGEGSTDATSSSAQGSSAGTDGATSSVPGSPSTSRTAPSTSSAPIPPFKPYSSSSFASLDVPLKKVQFTVSSMAVTYPIYNQYTPGSEDVTRRRVEREHRARLAERKRRTWTLRELEALYRDCCRTREELPLKKMRIVFQEAAAQQQAAAAAAAGGGDAVDAEGTLKVLDLTSLPLDRAAIDPLADLLSVDFGLNKLVLESCGLTDDVRQRSSRLSTVICVTVTV